MGSWNPLFSRHFNDWEMKEEEGLFWKLHPLVLNRDVEDVLSWKNSKNDSFSVRSLYRSFTRASSEPFSLEYYVEVLGSDEGKLFCLGNVLE